MKRRGALLLALVFVACADRTAPARRQTVVTIDTDALTPEDVTNDPDLSAALSIDTVRVDVLDDAGGVTVFREFSATGRLDWPLSFAVIPPETGDAPNTTLRIRAFRARDARTSVESGTPTLAPLPELALDRIITVVAPAPETVERLVVNLSAECFGLPASFGTKTSCASAAEPAVASSAKLPPYGGEPSRVGTSPLPKSVPCAAASGGGKICIPGGTSILGSTDVAGLEDGVNILASLPMRLVRISPFMMDEREMTVGRARPLLARLEGDPPLMKGDPDLEYSEFCTLTSDASSDPMPLNCVSDATAAELCALEGGALPTEAEWNHAASGRGEARLLPWGSAIVGNGCCNASVSRAGAVTGVSLCPGKGVENAGSHPASAACDGYGDISRDGVLDLGGSLTEIMADRAAKLDDACFGARYGTLVNPVCLSSTITASSTRGGNWSKGSAYLASAVRTFDVRSSSRGFRCVYREGGAR